MFDFHIHLARLPHPKQLTQLLYSGDYGFIAIACEPWEWESTANLKKEISTENKPFKTSYGIHPMIATQVSDADFERLKEYLQADRSASVGECGLDKRYPGYGENGVQEAVFKRQIELAKELGRDLQIHCVGDYGRVVTLLKTAHYPPLLQPANPVPRPVFHRFGGDAGIVRAVLPMGAIFSLHADSFKKKSTRAAIPLIPEQNIRFETDADETTFAADGRSASNGDAPEYNVEEVVQALKERWLAVKILWENLKV